MVLIHVTTRTTTTSSHSRWGMIGAGVSGKEIVAQRDTWTLIGENDTVDAGMHIRIDMTTGEKWVKQIVNDNDGESEMTNIVENDENVKSKHSSSSSSSSSSTSSTAVVVTVTDSDETGGNDATSTNEQQEQQQRQSELNMNGDFRSTTMVLPKQIIHNDHSSTTSSESEQKQQQSDPKYDYDMMYRTLRKLPIEEQIRIQLPMEYVVADNDNDDNVIDQVTTVSSLLSNVTTITKQRQQRQQFETKLRYIWEQRQKELLELEIADLPQILKEYIGDIQTYMTQQYRVDIDPSRNDPSTNTTPAVISHNHIISVLQELEYQLQDIDLTRDFHTLNGWNRLVSLLALSESNTHADYTTTTTHPSNNARSIYQQHEVQMHTAWVIGTALKHIPEFHTYAIEPIQLPVIVLPSTNTNTTATTTTTTTLDIVLQQIQMSYEEYVSLMRRKSGIPPQEKSTSETSEWDDFDSISKILQTKLLRFIYCLGSLLRGNYFAQQHMLLSKKVSQQPFTAATMDHNENSINLLQEFMNHLLLPSLQQLQHDEFVRSFATNNNSSVSSDRSSDMKQHIDFLYKFTQRTLNILSDCLDEIKSNVKDNNIDNPKWNLQNTNPTQYEQLQEIYKLWHRMLCNATSTSHSVPVTTEERILRHHQSNNSSILDLHSFISKPTTTSTIDQREELEELRSTIRSILGHCR
jgi:hypothetical protein